MIVYEVSLDQTYYFRMVYSMLDFVSEIGGLFAALSKLSLVAIAVVNMHGSF